MTNREIEKIYDDLEAYLIRNIKRNLTSDLKSFHLREEKALGFDWEAWQATKLRELKRYRRQNKDIINKRLANIDSQVADVLRREMRQGKLDAFKNFKEALTHGFKSSTKVKDSFFKLNDRKLNKLINSINNDFKTANKAVLRQSNDVYRQIITEASFYNQTGVMTERQAIRKAIRDFEARGINCIEYSNGSRHKISDYTKMAIRTASTRAYLQGEGEFRKRIGSTLVLMSKHNTACKLCQPWEGKVLIDDVYSGGSSKDGKYPLMSEAMKQGLYHPNCRHGHGTYYPELGKKTSNEIIEKVEEENFTLEQLQEMFNQPLDTSKWGVQGSRKNKTIPVTKKINNTIVNLDGMDTDYRKDIMEQVEYLVNKYNNNLYEVKYVDKVNKAFGDTHMAETKGNKYAKSINYYGYGNSKEFKEMLEEQIKKGHQVKIDKKDYGKYLITHEFGHSITLDVLPKSKITKIEEIKKRYILEKYNLKQQIKEKSNEWILDINNNNLKDEINSLNNRLEEINISTYAERNIDEFMAECFTDVELGTKTSKYSKEVYDIIVEENKKFKYGFNN